MKHPLFDHLRGLAALWVVVFHLQAGSPSVQKLPLISPVAAAGFLGVPMFFVISGFCLAAAASRTMQEGSSTAGFLRRRFWRILPPFWLSAIVAAFLVSHLALDWAGWLRVLTLTQIFDPSEPRVLDRFKALNGPYWSLAIEVQFYLVVAAALCLRRRFAVVLAAVTGLSLLCWLWPAARVTGVFLPYWLPFALGLGLHAVLRAGWKPEGVLGRWRVAAALAVLAAMALLTASGFWTYAFDPGGWTRGKPNIMAFAVLFTALLWLGHDCEPSRWLPRWADRAGLLAGAMSYSIYLVHQPLVDALQPVLRPWTGGGSVVFGVAVLGGTLAGCVAFWALCERPFLPGKPKKRDATAPKRELQTAQVVVAAVPVLAGLPEPAAAGR